MSSVAGECKLRRVERRAQRRDLRRVAVVGRADHQHVAPRGVVLDHARCGDLVGRVHHAADHPLGRHRARELAARVEAREIGRARTRRRKAERVPPGNPVLAEHQPPCRRRAAARAPSAASPSAVALTASSTASCAPSSAARSLARTRARDPLGPADQRDAVRAQRLELRAARQHRDLVSGAGQPRGEMAADRAGAEDADAQHVLQAKTALILTSLLV